MIFQSDLHLNKTYLAFRVIMPAHLKSVRMSMMHVTRSHSSQTMRSIRAIMRVSVL